MHLCLLSIKVKDGEIEGILRELDEAQEKIRDCYSRLDKLGVLTVEKAEAASGD